MPRLLQSIRRANHFRQHLGDTINAIFLSGGLGDIVALESHFPKELKQNLETVYLACRSAQPAAQLFRNSQAFPKLKNVKVIWTKFDEYLPAFFSLQHFCSWAKACGVETPDMTNVEDWSIQTAFNRIDKEQLQFSRSSFISKPCIKTPEHYAAIHPYSGSIPQRGFNEKIWAQVISYLEHRNIKGYVLGNDDTTIPRHRLLLNFNKSLTIQESIALTAHAESFFGVDSCLSVIAAQTHQPERLRVHTQNADLLHWRHIYFKPLTDFDFLRVL